jgi:predicted  nucleic acid-binding Zn-ribbon protein
MPQSKGTSLLKATDNFRRLEQKVTRLERALQKARQKRAEAEEQYLKLASEAFATRRAPPVAGQEEASANPTA